MPRSVNPETGRSYNFVDLTGIVMGKLTAVKFVGIKNKASYWTCRCECGNITILRRDRFVSGETKYCGCLTRRDNLHKDGSSRRGKEEDLTGKVFGKWTVLELLPSIGQHLCRCSCGFESHIFTGHLKSGHSSSCKQCSFFGKRTGTVAKKSLLAAYRKNAVAKDREFSLSEQEFFKLVKKPCHYCKKEPFAVRRCLRDSFIYNGIDRKDNSEGYTVSNCLPCCKVCNIAKHTMSYEEFLSWATLISKTFVQENKPCL